MEVEMVALVAPCRTGGTQGHEQNKVKILKLNNVDSSISH